MLCQNPVGWMILAFTLGYQNLPMVTGYARSGKNTSKSGAEKLTGNRPSLGYGTCVAICLVSTVSYFKIPLEMIPMVIPATADAGLLLGRVMEFLILTPQDPTSDQAQDLP
jgi:hypothetical protein